MRCVTAASFRTESESDKNRRTKERVRQSRDNNGAGNVNVAYFTQSKPLISPDPDSLTSSTSRTLTCRVGSTGMGEGGVGLDRHWDRSYSFSLTWKPPSYMVHGLVSAHLEVTKGVRRHFRRGGCALAAPHLTLISPLPLIREPDSACVPLHVRILFHGAPPPHFPPGTPTFFSSPSSSHPPTLLQTRRL